VRTGADITKYDDFFINNLVIPEVCVDEAEEKSGYVMTMMGLKGKETAQASSAPDGDVVLITSPENRKRGILGRLKASGGTPKIHFFAHRMVFLVVS
jgi:hypothetical protein